MNTFRETPVTRYPKARVLGIAVALGLAALVALGIVQRHANVVELQDVANESSVPPVQVILPMPGPPTRSMTLPGNIQAWYSAPIYAQVSGYVKKWYKDYGAQVKAGELLASIDAPTVDEQYEGAQADLDVARTNYNLADVTAKRWTALEGTQAVSQQEVDVQVANAAAQKAKVRAAQHQVARFKVLEGFKDIVAPFDGIVTSRNTDEGNYVNAAGGDVGARGAADELFSVSDIHEMRVFVSVPQDYSQILKPGLTAALSLPQYPGRTFQATFDTTANAFNPQTRTVVTELLVPNPDHLIWPGTYADVHFVIPSDPHILIVPEQALLFRAEGMQVALVGADGKVHLQNVKLGLNLGQTVQVISGLKPTDRLIVNPSAGILEGEKVRVVPGTPGVALSSQRLAPPPVPANLSDEQRAKMEAAHDDVNK
ncbi:MULTISPECIES: efflux RND transporter periplasmic adaptor subunit [Paraburkholderia]|uniref:RND family efflux transporter, MFP subunit n=1 Tax=Paraburkholderia megapolitana TaxID=420953 RepID=A0A1I3GFW5_9BURK|nr:MULTISPECIES: efflux RND transporter periplasmic adaptor subunit [Paraburkholderia]MCX4160256.1 efflux RND transporter periplasmic adaptor subunit [Paraburkholderia megapolitana]MDN7155755.1 efflux RND transporter periplasmic adaptor subunit [Paraburkholderia sp. CHISQ3]MDQ6492799.1 efflux RND transporter periplasmic adaptor subunit [Paraburkholderia megapolitana]QDQ82891.1 efflux RND transporter periplasmic adaptor subunit [Paraburkholderia megapolitana]SFI22380.1 RND family efflux transpo